LARLKEKHYVVGLHWLVTVVFCSSYCYEELHAENVSGHTGEADNKIWPFLAFCTGESSVRDRCLDQRFDTDESEIRFLNRSFLGNNDIVRRYGLEGS